MIWIGELSERLPIKYESYINPLSANPIKWSNTLKQFVGNLPTYCMSVFEYFAGLTFKGSKLY